jgi:hypothetical protein
VLLRWSPHRQGARYLAILEDVTRRSLAGGRRAPNPAWSPVAPSEPVDATAAHLEPYPPDLHGSTRAHRRPRRRTPLRTVVRTKAERLGETLREEGVGGVVRGTGRVFTRITRRATGRPPFPDDP